MLGYFFNNFDSGFAAAVSERESVPLDYSVGASSVGASLSNQPLPPCQSKVVLSDNGPVLERVCPLGFCRRSKFCWSKFVPSALATVLGQVCPLDLCHRVGASLSSSDFAARPNSVRASLYPQILPLCWKSVHLGLCRVGAIS